MVQMLMVRVSRPNAITNIEEENKELVGGGVVSAATGSGPNPTIDTLGWADRVPRGAHLSTGAAFDSPATILFSARQRCFAFDVLTALSPHEDSQKHHWPQQSRAEIQSTLDHYDSLPSRERNSQFHRPTWQRWLPKSGSH